MRKMSARSVGPARPCSAIILTDSEVNTMHASLVFIEGRGALLYSQEAILFACKPCYLGHKGKGESRGGDTYEKSRTRTSYIGDTLPDVVNKR
jgi:hypothetical protein